MKSSTCIFFVWLFIFSLSVEARFISDQEYDFPIKSSPRATLLSALAVVQDRDMLELRTEVVNRNVRSYPHRLSKFKKMRTEFFPAENKNSGVLVFVIAGLGGDIKSNLAQYLTGLAQDAGQSAVVMPNVFTPNFTVSGSRTGIIGDTLSDAQDMYRAMQAVLYDIKELGYPVHSVKIVSYSHGGLLSAFIAQIDRMEQKLNLESVLLVNPPVDLLYGVRVLDKKSDLGKNINVVRLIDIGLDLKNMISDFMIMPLSAESAIEFDSMLNLDENESQGVIGLFLKSFFPQYVLASQEVNDLGVLPPKPERGSTFERYQNQARARAARRFSFESYTDKILRVELEKTIGDITLDNLNERSSLTYVADEIISNPNVYIMHNIDDFLLREGEATWLESLAHDRVLIYPRGGHLGNIGFMENTSTIKKWLIEKRF